MGTTTTAPHCRSSAEPSRRHVDADTDGVTRKVWIVAAMVLGVALALPSLPAQAVAAPAGCPGCWRPPLKVSWQWQLQEPPRIGALLDVSMYDVDGFESTARLVRAMHTRKIAAVCYLSAGTWEKWRRDAASFPTQVLGKSNGWSGERGLDVRAMAVLKPIMRTRLAMCRRKGFDAVEFDNVDGFQNATGFPLTAAEQLRYDVFLANAAHRRGMSALLKNDLGQIRKLLPYFDAALNEQCFQYRECAALSRFIEAGKPVFQVEYKLSAATFCATANRRSFNALRKRFALAAWRVPCRGA